MYQTTENTMKKIEKIVLTQSNMLLCNLPIAHWETWMFPEPLKHLQIIQAKNMIAAERSESLGLEKANKYLLACLENKFNGLYKLIDSLFKTNNPELCEIARKLEEKIRFNNSIFLVDMNIPESLKNQLQPYTKNHTHFPTTTQTPVVPPSAIGSPPDPPAVVRNVQMDEYVICMDKNPTHAFIPYGHKSTQSPVVPPSAIDSPPDTSAAVVVAGNDQKNDECSFCMEKPPTYSFIPCGHKVLCEDCSKQEYGNGCLVCRKEYTTIIKIFD